MTTIRATAGGATYTYDGDGNRVKKSSGTLYWGGGALVERDLSGTASSLKEYIMAGGRRIARRDNVGTGNVFFYLSDNLGSSREIVASGATSACYDADFYPYGGERAYINTCPQNYKFTGKERDLESGLDNFKARFDSSTLGRFMSADPMGGHLADPQTLNRYAYVRNNPMSLTDPTGLDIWLACSGASETCHKRHWWNSQRYVGTWDKDHKNFERTHLTGDQTKNATLTPHGISVNYKDNKYEGVWDTNKGENGAVTVSGGALKGYDAKVTGNCSDTCVASGSIFSASNPKGSASGLFAVLSGSDSGYVKEAGLDAIDTFHPGATNFRGHSDGDPPVFRLRIFPSIQRQVRQS